MSIPERIRWWPFVVPAKLLDTVPTPSSALSRLPTEILIKIFDFSTPLSQLLLAITCKRLLQVSTLVSLKTSSSSFTKKSNEDLHDEIQELLRCVKPLNKFGRPKKAWHLCVWCMLYRPTRESYWKKNQKGLTFDFSMTPEWKNVMKSWKTKYSLLCPQCQKSMYLNRFDEETGILEIKRRMNSATFIGSLKIRSKQLLAAISDLSQDLI